MVQKQNKDIPFLSMKRQIQWYKCSINSSIQNMHKIVFFSMHVLRNVFQCDYFGSWVFALNRSHIKNEARLQWCSPGIQGKVLQIESVQG